MMRTEKMTRKAFEALLFDRFGALTYRKVREEAVTCWLYYLNGQHVATWTGKLSFIHKV